MDNNELQEFGATILREIGEIVRLTPQILSTNEAMDLIASRVVVWQEHQPQQTEGEQQ